VPAPQPASPLVVADSWLVEDGSARALDAHWARFGEACLRSGVQAGELERLRRAVEQAVPPAGRWFPRVELRAGGLSMSVRPAPPAQLEATVAVAPPGDPRRCPRVKGPDLEALVALRAAAPADELLLCDDDGTLIEGALSSLLWWEDDVLCTTPAEVTLPGITRALLLARARERGIDVRVRSPRPAELAGREVWLTSALHGIRTVSAWLDPVQPAGPPRRAGAWRGELSRSTSRAG
jgi:branched-subunit amino acid aminotransferase/4-amino-4-deoxychorismate lyase